MSLKSRINDKIQADSDKMNEWLEDPNVSQTAKTAYKVADELGQTAYEALESTLPVLKRTGIKTYEPATLTSESQEELLKNASKAVLKAIDNIDKVPQLGDKTKYQIKKAAKTIINFAMDNDDEIVKASKILSALPKDVAISLIHLPQLPKSYANKLLRTFIKRGGVKLTNTIYRNNPKGKNNKSKALPVNISKKGKNDVSWYMKYPGLTDAANGLQFQMPNGQTVATMNTQGYKLPAGNWTRSNNNAISTVAALRVRLTIGSLDPMTYLNRIYSSLRRVNSGAINYTTLDIHEYLVNYRLLLAMFAMGKRAYGLVSQSSRYDVKRPQILFAAFGLDYDTFMENAANLRYKLNIWAERLKLYAPLNLPIYERTAWMFDNVYRTSEGYKDQLVVMALQNTQYYYNYATQAGANITTMVDLSTTGTGMTYSNWMASFETLVNNMLNSPNNVNAIIAGDMMKAFGTQNIRQLSYIDESYQTPVVYNEEVLDQISNATLVPGKNITVAITGSRANGDNKLSETVLSVPETDRLLADPVERLFLNTDKNSIDAGYIMQASRFMVDWVMDASNDWVPKSYGSELPVYMYLFRYNSTSSYAYNLLVQTVRGTTLVDMKLNGSWEELNHLISQTKTFDFLPKFRLLLTGITSGTQGSIVTVDNDGKITDVLAEVKTLSELIYDWANWAPVSSEEANSLNDIALQSLYYVPLVVKPARNTLTVD